MKNSSKGAAVLVTLALISAAFAGVVMMMQDDSPEYNGNTMTVAEFKLDKLAKNFGGAGADQLSSVIISYGLDGKPDGYVAAGYATAQPTPIALGDGISITFTIEMSGLCAVIIKFGLDSTVLWAEVIGGADNQYFGGNVNYAKDVGKIVAQLGNGGNYVAVGTSEGSFSFTDIGSNEKQTNSGRVLIAMFGLTGGIVDAKCYNGPNGAGAVYGDASGFVIGTASSYGTNDQTGLDSFGVASGAKVGSSNIVFFNKNMTAVRGTSFGIGTPDGRGWAETYSITKGVAGDGYVIVGAMMAAPYTIPADKVNGNTAIVLCTDVKDELSQHGAQPDMSKMFKVGDVSMIMKIDNLMMIDWAGMYGAKTTFIQKFYVNFTGELQNVQAETTKDYQNYSVKLVASTGWVLPAAKAGVTVKIGATTLDGTQYDYSTDGTVTIKVKITGDVTINATCTKSTYALSFESALSGIASSKTKEVTHGEQPEIQVNITPGYNVTIQSVVMNGKPLVKGTDYTYDANNGKLKILKSVDGGIIVTVSGELKIYTVTIPKGNATPGVSTIKHGEYLSTTLYPASGSKFVGMNSIKVGSTTLAAAEYNFVAATGVLNVFVPITGDVVIDVANTPNMVNVSISAFYGNATGTYAWTDKTSVEMNKTANILITAKAGWRVYDISVKMGGQQLVWNKDFTYQVMTYFGSSSTLNILIPVTGAIEIRVVTTDPFMDVVTVGDGYIAVGFLDFSGNSVSFGSIELTGYGNNDIIIVKFAKGGDRGIAQVVWAESIGGTGNDGLYGVAQNENGDFVAVGYFSLDLTITNTVSGVALQKLSAVRGEDMLMITFRGDGKVISARGDGSVNDDAWLDVVSARDASGNVIGTMLVGYVSGDANIFDKNVSSSGGKDIVVAGDFWVDK